MKPLFRSQKNQSGYMIVEILVSLSVFSIIAVTSTAAILVIIDANAKSQSTRAAIDNLGVAVENMSRALRIGTAYKCVTGTPPAHSESIQASVCNAGTTGVSFVPQDAAGQSDRVIYYAATDSVSGKGMVYRRRNGESVAVTSPEVDVKGLRFYTFGMGKGDGQPRVLISVYGTAGVVERVKSTFLVQTSVSQRQKDCDSTSPSVCP